MKAYVILNESVPKYGSSVYTELLPQGYFKYQSALDQVRAIANDSDVEIDDDQDSVYLPCPPGSHWSSDEYYIVEMEIV